MTKGFTLIETLIYIVLFIVIIGGILVAAYQIVQASLQTQENSLVQEEVQFLLAKINWELTGVKNVNLPASGTPGPALDVDKFDGSNAKLLGINPNLLKQPGNILLNSDSITVENVVFTYINPAGNRPAAVKADFKVTSKLTDYSENATITKFLRK